MGCSWVPGDRPHNRPAHIVAPGSRMPEGEYQFIQGSPSLFTRQPEPEYIRHSWALPQHALFETLAHRSGPGVLPDLGEARPASIPSPPILRLLDFLRRAESAPVHKVSQRGTVLLVKYGSRSEAEQALVYGGVRRLGIRPGAGVLRPGAAQARRGVVYENVWGIVLSTFISGLWWGGNPNFPRF